MAHSVKFKLNGFTIDADYGVFKQDFSVVAIFDCYNNALEYINNHINENLEIAEIKKGFYYAR